MIDTKVNRTLSVLGVLSVGLCVTIGRRDNASSVSDSCGTSLLSRLSQAGSVSTVAGSCPSGMSSAKAAPSIPPESYLQRAGWSTEYPRAL